MENLYLGKPSRNRSSLFQISKLNTSLPPTPLGRPYGLGECGTTRVHPTLQKFAWDATIQGALKLIDTGVFKAKSKHIDFKYHHVHDEQKNHGTVDLHYAKAD